jgi:Ca2+-binding RTX toxin-like protein
LGDDTIWGNASSDETMYGGDVMHGTGGIVGGFDQINGDDTLTLLAGTGLLLGGAGDDTCPVGATTTVTTSEDADNGFDTIWTAIELAPIDNVEAIILTGTGDINTTGAAQTVKITGNSGNNSLDAQAATSIATLDGGAGMHQLWRSSGGDTQHGGADHDCLQDYQGNDSLFGGSGDDTLVGGNHNDTLTGGGGAHLCQRGHWRGGRHHGL